MRSSYLSMSNRLLALGFHLIFIRLVWLISSLPRPGCGNSITDAPRGAHVQTLPDPVTIQRSFECGLNLKLFTGFRWMSTLASSKVVMSQIHTVCGLSSHLVAMKCEVQLHSILEIPVGGPAEPTVSNFEFLNPSISFLAIVGILIVSCFLGFYYYPKSSMF